MPPARWHSTSPLASGAHYTVRVSTEDEDGAPGRKVVEFDTGAGKAKKVNVTFGPDAGTYGVGQPVTATLSEPVKNRAAAEEEQDRTEQEGDRHQGKRNEASCHDVE